MIFIPYLRNPNKISQCDYAMGSDLNQSRHQIDEHEISLVGVKASRDPIIIPK